MSVESVISSSFSSKLFLQTAPGGSTPSTSDDLKRIFIVFAISPTSAAICNTQLRSYDAKKKLIMAFLEQRDLINAPQFILD